MSTILQNPAVIASLIAAAVSIAGLVAVWFNRVIAERYSVHFAAFASGFVLSAALLHLAPEGLEESHDGALFLLGGYVALYVLRSIGKGANGGEQDIGAGLAALAAIGFHSFLDGVVYSISFSAGLETGLYSSAGLIIHEFAESVILFVLLRAAGFGGVLSFVLALVGASLTTPLGAIFSVAAIRELAVERLGELLSIAAGALIYVGATHLSAHMGGESGRRTMFTFLAGIAVAVLATGVHHAGH
ncbi:MAG: hypothetical protein AAGC95_01325 [Pseudomonadota bacterium]